METSTGLKRSHSSSPSPQPAKRQLIEDEGGYREARCETNDEGETIMIPRRFNPEPVASDLETQELELATNSFRRLDYKTGFEICDRAIESDYANKASFLLLRSSIRGKRWDPEGSEQDASAALRMQEAAQRNSIQARISAGFAHLRLAKEHFNEAESMVYDSDYTFPSDSSFIEEDLDSFQETLIELESRQFPNRIHNFPQEVLARMFSSLSSMSLVRAMAVQIKWKSLILEYPQLFQSLEMTGKADDVVRGVEFFSSKCNNQMETLRLKINSMMFSDLRVTLVEVLKKSSNHLKCLSIGHNGDLDSTILEIASVCSSIQEVQTSITSHASASAGRQKLTFRSNSSQLEKFVWNTNRVGIVCDETLLNSLSPSCKEIAIHSPGTSPTFMVKVLSTFSKLERLSLGSLASESVADIPLLTCNHLTNLRVKSVPKSFLSKLVCPNLKVLHISSVDPQELETLPVESVPSRLCIDRVESSTSSDQESIGSSLVKAIKDWNTKHLDIGLKDTTFTQSPLFYNSIFYSLSPFSRENIAAGLDQTVPLSNLTSLVMGPSAGGAAVSAISIHTYQEKETKSKLDGKAISSFLNSRKAVSRKLSSFQVMSAANGVDFKSDSSLIGEPTELQCEEIRYLRITLPILCGKEIQERLEGSGVLCEGHRFVSISNPSTNATAPTNGFIPEDDTDSE